MLLLLAAGSALAGWPEPEPAGLSLRLGGQHSAALVPPFRAASRERSAGELSLGWAPPGPLQLRLSGDYLRDAFASGSTVSGPGDLRLTTDALLWSGALDVHGRWQVKLPNANDRAELGTDETDATLSVEARRALGDLALGATAGLAIVGNPLMFANQDDLLITHLSGSLPAGPLRISADVGGSWATSRNPARMAAELGAEGRCPWLGGVAAGAGLTPAAADWMARVWLGWGWGCPSP